MVDDQNCKEKGLYGPMPKGLNPGQRAKLQKLQKKRQEATDAELKDIAWLPERAKSLYMKLKPTFESKGMFLTLLEIYCVTYDRIITLEEDIKKEGLVIIEDNGERKANPLLKVLNSYRKEHSTLQRICGLNKAP